MRALDAEISWEMMIFPVPLSKQKAGEGSRGREGGQGHLTEVTLQISSRA